MTIYSSTNYRKIYEQHFGPIPKDENGRTYEIHHIDSNHSNNDPANLKCVTIQEHYDIHYSQGDWGACFRMAERMKLSSHEISELASKSLHQRVANGTNPFCDPEFHRKNALKRVADGTHNFLGGEVSRKLALRMVEEGTHKFLGGEIQRKTQRRLVEEGKHHLLSGDIQRKSNKERLSTGTHNLVGSEHNKKMLTEGKHTSQQMLTCHCGVTMNKMLFARYHGGKCKVSPQDRKEG
jgi:hypothetical protein